MRFVHEHVRPMFAADVDNLFERGDVAANRIQPLDDDQPIARATRQPLQFLAQAFGRIVAET
jgi:hypothetical protein